MVTEMICRAKSDGKYDSVRVSGVTIEQQIEDDRKFGFLSPKNGVLNYIILNNDKEITEKQVKRAVSMALFGWRLHVPIKFRRVKNRLDADITVQFNSEEDDELLDKNTLAYMYYPLGGINDGRCVVNKRFHWTNHGKGVDMHEIDPTHYPIPTPSNPKGKTWDLDKVLRHEFGHGVFGLPHSQSEARIMSGNESFMAEFFTGEDITRAQAKAGIREGFAHRLKQLTGWYKIRSNNS
jgi:hypothetical protein